MKTEAEGEELSSVWSSASAALAIEIVDAPTSTSANGGAPTSNGHGPAKRGWPAAKGAVPGTNGAPATNGKTRLSDGARPDKADPPLASNGAAHVASDGRTNGHPRGGGLLRSGLFEEAFDADEVRWIDDQPVFRVRLGQGLAQNQQPGAAMPAALRAPAPERPTVRPAQPPLRPVEPAPSRPTPAPARTPSSAPAQRPATITRLRARAPRVLTITPAHVAWLFLLPIVAFTLTAGLLAPLIGHQIFPRPTWNGLPTVGQNLKLIAPEPDEEVRYLIGLGAAALMVLLLGLAWSQLSGLRQRRRLTVMVMAAQVAGVALAGLCLVQQERYRHWFSGWDVLAALGIAGGLLLVARSGPPLLAGVRLVAAIQASPRRWITTAVVVALVIVVSGLWLLPGVFQDRNVADADEAVRYHLQFTFDEFLSATNGRTALVNFIPQYSRLMPFVVEPVFSVFGATIGTFTWTMWVLSLTSVVAVYFMFRVVTGGPVAALVPYAPFLAVTMVAVRTVGDQRITLGNLYGVLPLRVVGPFVLACLCACELRRRRPGRTLALFLLAGLVAVNNPEFGLPCFVGIGAALWCGRDRQRGGWREARQVGTQALAGAAASVVLVSLFTLVRTSALPRWDYVNHFARIFAVEGFGMVRMPLVGLHIIIYMTFVGALVAAVAASVGPSPPRNPVLNGMLAYSGVLGLGALSYWVGRSHPDALFGMFPTWGLSVGLLGWWVLSSVASGSTASAEPSTPSATVRVLALPALAVMVSFGLMLLLFRQFPPPSQQIHRVTTDAVARYGGPQRNVLEPPSSFDGVVQARFVSRVTKPGEHVAILASLGHRIADRSGVVDVAPYAHQDAIVFTEQMAFVLETVENEGATKIFLGPSYPEIVTFLQLAGYSMTELDQASQLSLWQRSTP